MFHGCALNRGPKGGFRLERLMTRAQHVTPRYFFHHGLNL